MIAALPAARTEQHSAGENAPRADRRDKD
jgi:hypothetical protein